jgi:cytochrome c553
MRCASLTFSALLRLVRGRALALGMLAWFGLIVVGCKQDDMANQPKLKPLGASTYFADGKASRPLVPNTVARSGPTAPGDALPWTDPVSESAGFPFAITASDLHLGQEQFTIFCTPCHGQVGEGNGIVVMRGLTPPPSYHLPRLRAAAPGHFFNVMTNGYGAMFSVNDRVPPDDRWRIAAYIKALQLSQNAPLAELTDAEKREINGAQ